MTKRKLATLLGLRDKVEKTFKNMLDDMFKKFKKNQGLFKGYRKTYEPLDGYADDDTKRGHKNVASTVAEQLSWFKEHTRDYFNTVLAVEKTNAGGITADLVVDGDTWGTYTSLELLRLKSILDSKFRDLLDNLPIRDETIIWKPSEDENHVDREIDQSPLTVGHSKTTLKESYILPDPHPDTKRQPQVAEKSTQVNIGKYTSQDFSGEITAREKAEFLVKYDKLYTAIIEALETANNAEVQESNLGDKALDYFFK